VEQEQPTVEWMPGFAAGVLTLVLTQFAWVLGTALAAAALVGLVVLLVRHERRPLLWVCVGALIGFGVFWAVVGGNALA